MTVTDKGMLLLPSMMCADFSDLGHEVDVFEAAGADGFHLDVMDGSYVPNFGLGMGDVNLVCSRAKVPCDVHLMIEEPDRYVGTFAEMGTRVIYVHPDSGRHTCRTLQHIRDLGVQSGIAVNPDMPLCEIEPLLGLVDHVLVMTVSPGFAGQKYLPFVNEKIRRLAAIQGELGFDIVIDGNCTPERIADGLDMGVRGFVLGTASLFGKGRPYEEIIQEIHGMGTDE